jgi:hypothetical protein
MNSNYLVALYDQRNRLAGAGEDWDFVEMVMETNPHLKAVVVYDTTIEQLDYIDDLTAEWEVWTESLSD